MERRTLHAKKLVLTIDVVGQKPDNSPEYEVGIWIARDEIEAQFNIDLFDLKRVLLSQKELVLGLVFEYLTDDGSRKDIVVTRKIKPVQAQQIKQTPIVIVILAERDGTLVKGISAELVLKD